MVNLRFVLVAVAITLGISSFGCSQGPGPEPTPAASEDNVQAPAAESGQARAQVQWWRDESITARLELTDDQVQAIEEVMTNRSGDSGQSLQDERRLTLLYLRALSQEPYDPELVERTSARLIEVLAEVHRRRVERLRALRDILTQEQWTELWEVAPRVLQIGRFRALRGPRIAVSGDDDLATPTP